MADDGKTDDGKTDDANVKVKFQSWMNELLDKREAKLAEEKKKAQEADEKARADARGKGPLGAIEAFFGKMG